MDSPSAQAAEPASTSIPWVYLSSLSFLLSGAIFYLYLARVLPATDLGAVVILSAIAALMAVVFSLGIGPGFQHFLSFYLGRSDIAVVRRLVRSAFFFCVTLATVSSLATLILSTLFSNLFFHTGAYTTAIEVLAIFTGVSTANTTLQSVLLGLHRFVAYSVVYSLAAVATYGFAVGFFVLWTGVDSIVMGWALGASLGCAAAVAAIVRTRRGSTGVVAGGVPAVGESNLHRSILTYSLPLFVWSVLATGATYVDRLVLASVANLASVGVYNYALLLATGSMVAVGPFSTILTPKASKLFGEQNKEEIRAMTRGASTLIALVYLPIGLGMAALGPVLLRYLAGPGFVAASLPMLVLLVVTAVFVPYTILSSIAASTRRTFAYAKAAALALVANVALSVVLVPRFGMLGAAVGNSSMVWVPFTVFYLELRNTGYIAFDVRSMARIWLASGVMAVIVGVPLWFLDYNLAAVAIFVLIGIVCLAALLRFVGAISTETAGTLLRLLPTWLRGLRHVIYWLAPGYRNQSTTPGGGAGLTYSR